MKSYGKYLNYVIRHKWFVFQAGLKMSVSLWRLMKHDWSKFLPSEFIPYARYFYGDRERYLENERVFKATGINAGPWMYEIERNFNIAWLLHQHRNDHHWQHWMLRNDDGTTECLPMAHAARKEMIADWMGAGRAITGQWEAAEWYAKNYTKIQLHQDTREFVDSKLGVER